MIRRAMTGVAAVAALACAGVPRAPRGYSFPAAFEVTQVVSVDQGRPGGREFLASLRRIGDDYDVTLFDAALEVPLLSVSVREGAVNVQVMAPGMDGAFGHRLLALLQDLYGRDFPPPLEGRTEDDTETFAVHLAGLPGRNSPCPFPSTIQVVPHRIGDPRLLVRTIDVGCTPGRRAP